MRRGTGELMMRSRLEVMPYRSVQRQLRSVPRYTMITVTCSPRHGIDHTLDFADELVEMGFTVVPHISARMVEGTDHLEQIAKRVNTVGYTNLFVIGGDSTPPIGPFADAGQLLDELAPRIPGARIGIAGYPEGHPAVEDRALLDALLAKQRYAAAIVTQLCFDADTIVEWIRTIRAYGVSLPVLVGLPGPVKRTRLLELATQVGVGASLRFARKNASLVTAMLRPATFRTDDLVSQLARHMDADHSLDVTGLHLYTFNEVTATDMWRHRDSRRDG